MFFYSRDPRFLRQAATFEAKDRSSYLDRISLSHSNCHNFKFRFEFENSASMWHGACGMLLFAGSYSRQDTSGVNGLKLLLFLYFLYHVSFLNTSFLKLQENELSSANTKTLPVGFARRELSFEWSHL